MTNASANTKEAHHPHTSKEVAETGGAHRLDSAHSADNFLSSVQMLKGAEKSAAAKLEAARKEAAGIEAEAKEKAVEINAKASEQAVQAKNGMLAEGREKSEKEVAAIIGDAKRQAEKIRSKRLAEKDVQFLSEKIA